MGIIIYVADTPSKLNIADVPSRYQIPGWRLDGIERFNGYLHLDNTFLSEKEENRGAHYPVNMLLRKYEHFANWATDEFVEDIEQLAIFGDNATLYRKYLDKCKSRAGRLFGQEASGMLQDTKH